jgi:hypothetical protein
MQSAAPQTGAVSGTRMAQKTIKPTKQRNNMYMSAKGSTHKSKKTSTKGGY